MSTIIKVKVAKAKTTIDVDFDELPDNVRLFIVEQGLSKLLNAATAKETAATTPDEAVRGANALALANKKLDALKRGEFKRASSRDGKVAGVVMTEARRLAKNIIKAQIKKQGQKISDYEAKAITEAANAYLGEHPELIAAAQASIDANVALATQASVNVSAIPVSETKVKANEAKKAAARAATEAKNAGKPGGQKSTTKKQAKPVPQRKQAPAELRAGA